MAKAKYTPSQTNIAFAFRNAAGQWWNTSGLGAFENYNGSNLASYRVTATETPVGSGIYVSSSDPANATEFELRLIAATLADSLIVAGPALTDTGSKVQIRAALSGRQTNLGTGADYDDTMWGDIPP